MHFKVVAGMELYDDREDRYILVDSVNPFDHTASCTVSECLDEDDLDYSKIYHELFTINELSHFKTR